MSIYSQLKQGIVELNKELDFVHSKITQKGILINDKNAFRNKLERQICYLMDMICQSNFEKLFVRKMIILFIIKRAIYLPNGNGYKTVSYWLFIVLHRYYPEIMETLLYELPKFGCWNDLNALYKIIYMPDHHNQYFMAERLKNKILTIWCERLSVDEYELKSWRTAHSNVSLLAKWIPKERRSLDKDTKVVREIVKKYYPNDSLRLGKTKYRMLVSSLNRGLRTAEVLMCSKQYSSINFSDIPKKCLIKNKRAWMDEKKGGQRRNIALMDRTLGRYNYLDYINNKTLCSAYTTKQPILLCLIHPAYKYYNEMINHLLE